MLEVLACRETQFWVGVPLAYGRLGLGHAKNTRGCSSSRGWQTACDVEAGLLQFPQCRCCQGLWSPVGNLSSSATTLHSRRTLTKKIPLERSNFTPLFVPTNRDRLIDSRCESEAQ